MNAQSSSTSSRTPVPRMSADERRAQVLAAATRAFARHGYAGTSTDAVAREAGVSQPYVVRMFGTKHELFLAVFARAADRIKDAFSAVIDDGFDPAQEADWKRLGEAYADLLADHDFLQVMMHGFAAGADDQIGAEARRCMGDIYELLLDTGCEAAEATGFVAHGMLLNILMSMHAPQHAAEHPGVTALTTSAFGEEGLERVRRAHG